MRSIILLADACPVLIIGCNCPDKKEDPIRSQNNQIVKLYLAEIWNLQNISIADSIIGDDFIDPASTTG